MNYVYFIENNQYVKVNLKTGKIKLRRDYPYIYIPKATEKQMTYLRMMWAYRDDVEECLWFGVADADVTSGGFKCYINKRSQL